MSNCKSNTVESNRRSRLIAVAIVAATAALLLAASPAGAVSRSFFGIVASERPEASDFEMMGDAGVGTFRFQLDWRNIQSTEGGAYNWSGPDEQFENAALNGIEPLPILYGTPEWVGANREPPLGSEQDKQAYKDFVAAAVERYGAGGDFWQSFAAEHPGVGAKPPRAWQISNEQNSPSYWEPKPSPKKYAELVRISDEAIDGVDQSADVLLGGMFGTPSRNKGIYSWKFLKKLYQVNGIESHFEAIALHPYSPNLAGIRAQIELAREKVKKAGDRAAIWITEIGWGSAGTPGQPLSKTAKGQKKLLRKSFNLLLDRRGKWKIRRVLWFTWRDPSDGTDPVGVVCGWCGSAGLLDADRDPKPAFHQFRTIAGGS
jgi:Glycosyl hydrolase catalytic core